MSRLERRWGVEGEAKYGFVYRWRESVNGRYYIGSHWGRFGDRYICSSRSMRKTYKRRPDTFKRRIVAVVTTNRLDLLAAEQAALDKMPRGHFGGKAYNVSTKVHKPWWAKGSKLRKSTVRKLKAAWKKPGRRELMRETARNRTCSAETRARMSKSAKRRFATEEGRAQLRMCAMGREPWNKGKKSLVPAWNKGTKQPALTSKHRKKIAASLAGRVRSKAERDSISRGARKRWLSSEYRKKISESRRAARAAGSLKITPKQAKRIRSLHATGSYTLRELGHKFDVGPAYVHGVLHHPEWDAVCST